MEAEPLGDAPGRDALEQPLAHAPAPGHLVGHEHVAAVLEGEAEGGDAAVLAALDRGAVLGAPPRALADAPALDLGEGGEHRE